MKTHNTGLVIAPEGNGAASANQCAKMFAVHRVAECLMGAKYPSGQDYLHTQTSCFIAAGIADEFRLEVRKAWRDFDIEELAALDYCELVKSNDLVERKAVQS